MIVQLLLLLLFFVSEVQLVCFLTTSYILNFTYCRVLLPSTTVIHSFGEGLTLSRLERDRKLHSGFLFSPYLRK